MKQAATLVFLCLIACAPQDSLAPQFQSVAGFTEPRVPVDDQPNQPGQIGEPGKSARLGRVWAVPCITFDVDTLFIPLPDGSFGYFIEYNCIGGPSPQHRPGSPTPGHGLGAGVVAPAHPGMPPVRIWPGMVEPLRETTAPNGPTKRPPQKELSSEEPL